MKFTCINIQGNLISEEVLTNVGEATASDQLPKNFGLEQGANLRDEIEYAWSRIKLDWKHFADRSNNLPAADPYGTTLARKWMEQFFTSIGYELEKHRTNLVGENKQEYSISNTSLNNDGMPIAIVGFKDVNNPDKNTLEIKSSGGTSRLSPHGTVQEYLNVTGHVYGFATNGFTLRLIRDSGRLVKLSYIEFDIRRLLDEDKYSEFTVLYRLIHSSRFPSKKEDASQAPIEKYYLESIETGNRIRDGLSLAVKESMVALGNGFLQHPNNEVLRTLLKDKKISPKQYYDQLRRLVYRLLFLMVTEERDLIYDPEDKTDETAKKKSIYLKFYSIARLRKLSQSRYLYEAQFTDIWQGLVNTFNLFEEGGNGLKIGVKPLAGDLFSDHAIADISQCTISNNLLLECLRNLNEFRDKDSKNLVPINYRSLDVEELGSVYEGLLELFPVIEHLESTNSANIRFAFHEGTERKTTGSYYTRPDLVNELIKSALIPVIEERLKEAGNDKEKKLKSLIKLKVCDAAAGSGHMMLAAARTIAWYMAVTDTGEENPPPAKYRYWLREAIQHCVYAVDMNPDAVELCKLALWLEGHNSGKPLSFLDHKIRNGNSLVGVTDLSVLKKGIPDDAFNPVTGDDKKICQELKKENAKYNKTKQGTFDFDQTTNPETKQFSDSYNELENIRQDDIEAVKKTKKKFEELRSNHQWWTDWTACNLWTSAFFFEYTEEHKQCAPNSERLEKYLNNPSAAYGPMVGKANALSMENKFFHWPLEFPDVFEQGGFDVMLGNPPWEIIELKEQEFFANREPKIANSENKASRTKLIDKLESSNPSLFNEYLQESHRYDSTRKFLQGSGRNTLTAFGRINMYPIFAENFYNLISHRGRAAIIVPTGIATDDSNKLFFGNLIQKNKIISLFDFENKEAIFPNVHRMFKFSLLTISGYDIGTLKPKFGFFLTRVENLQDNVRVFSLAKEDFLRLNPNTKTCPVFRTKIDAELTTKIYSHVPILVNEETGENSWGISYRQGLFNMSSDSNLFKVKNQLEEEGFVLSGNKMKQAENVWLPLYESKMIWHYDHRYGSYSGIESRTSTQTPTPKLEQYQDPNFQILPWYWVEKKNVDEQLVKRDSEGNVLWQWNYKWLLGFRDITNSTNERTAILSVEPYNAVGNNNPILFHKYQAIGSLLLQGNFSAIVFDYPTRFKIAGTHMNFFYVNQLPVLNYESYDIKTKDVIIQKSIELIYTCWDIKAFADDIWKELDENTRISCKKQWKENKAATGGHEFTPPDWCEIDPEGCPLPPFKWNEERRAVLKAELDAIYAKLYGLTTEELRYILDPQDVYGPDFPGETFRVLKDKEIKKFGEYRTRRLVLEAWDKLNKAN
jgi:hypothetical protein